MIRGAGWPDFAKLTALGAIWGSAFLCIEIALRGFGPLQVAAGRIALGATILVGIVILLRRPLPRDPKLLVWIFVIGALNSALPFFLIAWGQQSITSARSAILMATGPIVTLVVSHFLSHDDRFSFGKLLAVVFGFAGVAVLVGPQAVQGGGGLTGHLAVMGAAACYSLAAVLSRQLDGLDPLVSSALVLASATPYLLPLAWIGGWPQTWPVLESVLALVFLGVFPTALAYLLRFQIIRAVGASFMSQVSYLVPLFAVLWSWLFLGRLPGWTVWLALGLILAGLAASRFGSHRSSRASAGR